MEKLKIGFIPAHRNLMDEGFAVNARNEFCGRIAKFEDIQLICPDENLTKGGLVRNYDDALKVQELFYERNIDCIVLGAMTFGDERSALSIVERFNKLPVFLFGTAEPEIPDGAFFKSAAACGLLPISFGLKRRNIKFTFGGIAGFNDEKFSKKIRDFFMVVNAIKNFKHARIGMVGSRPNDFEVCAVNEALMINRFMQKIIHIDLIDLKNDMDSIPDNNNAITAITDEIMASSQCNYSREGLNKVAKLEIQLLKYIKEYNLDTVAIQCWTSIQKYIGVTPCLTNGRITSLGFPVSCEGDINNSLAMLFQQKLTFDKKTPMLLDILALHPEEKNLLLLWHCGNVSAENVNDDEIARVMPQCPWENEFGREKAAASIEFLIKSGPVTVNSLVEHDGKYKCLSFKGELINKQSNIRGAYSWIEVKNRDELYAAIVNEGFTHHASVIHSDLGRRVSDFCSYLDIEYISL